LSVDNAILAPPIIRPVVRSLEPGTGEHILLYSTTGEDEEQLREILSKFEDQKFYIYGFKKDLEYKNCIFKKRSTDGFLADLASARGVIASAGFSLISECLHLKKKMLMLPLTGQYEQIINAYYIEKLGLGISAKKLNKAVLTKFLNELDKPMPDDKRIIWPDNDRFFGILQEVLNKLHKPISIAVD
jgi:uncharacterized protein (TIGR00661 family)